MKICIACGMPMTDPSEFAMNDINRDYCTYCSREDGTMQSYQEKLESMTDFIIKTQGIDRAIAKSAAESMMMKLPAWR